MSPPISIDQQREAREALAVWFFLPDRARYLAAAKKALEVLAEYQRQQDIPPSDFEDALRRSLASVDAINLRDTLLGHLYGYPLDLLSGSPWKFGTEADRLTGDELVAAVRTFCEDFYDDDFDPATVEVCQPEAVVLKAEHMVLLGCSHPPDAPPRFFMAQLRSDDGQGFRAGELMCKVVAAAAGELGDSGHRFFQGLDLKERVGEPKTRVPLYEMRFSSDGVQPGVDPEIGWERLKDLDRWRRDRGSGAVPTPPQAPWIW